MRAILATFLLLSALLAVHASEVDDTPIQRHLVGLRLGDKLKRVREIIPPTAEWTSTDMGKGLKRYRIDHTVTKSLSSTMDVLYIGVKDGRLVEIQAVYSEKKSRDKSVDRLIGDYSLYYGVANRAGEKYWWSDGETVLRIFSSELPVAKSGTKTVALRSTVQIFEAKLVDRGE